ncbi:MAG: PocR ligand-binding domain-containing protein [Clostridia bacterium]|nr:PocR ligand-binding domain-containing protein [Clostridia bacterium]
MKVNFDLKKLNELLDDFHKVTGLTVSLWDSEHNQLAYSPKIMPRFCRMIKATKQGEIACLNSDISLCKLSYEKKEPVVHYCHAGIVDVATPILYNDTLLGYMMFGQVLEKGANKPNLEVCKSYGLNESEVLSAYSELKFFDKENIDSAMNILKVCTYYLWISQMISPEKNLLAHNLELYLSENLSEDITVDSICKRFEISKNKLYKVFDDFFGKTFNNYLTAKRVEFAKNLLDTTDKPIYQICIEAGIPDYNYFTKVFKKVVGIPPRVYRKGKK